jgi:hypothetical protein
MCPALTNCRNRLAPGTTGTHARRRGNGLYGGNRRSGSGLGHRRRAVQGEAGVEVGDGRLAGRLRHPALGLGRIVIGVRRVILPGRLRVRQIGGNSGVRRHRRLVQTETVAVGGFGRQELHFFEK